MSENSRLIFYAPWPLFGKKFNKQLIPVRENFQSLTPLVRAATVDQESSRVDDDLAGWALGESGFRNRVRIYYDKTANEFKIQANRGTESVPIWHDCLRVRESDCMVIAENGIQAEGGFYGLSFPRNLTRSQQFTGNVWSFQHNLNTFPVIAQAVSDTGKVLTPTRIDVSDPNVTYFYFTTSQPGTAIVTADSTNAQQFNPFYLTITQTDAASTLITAEQRLVLKFKSNDFYVSKIENDVVQVSLDRTNLGGGGAVTVTFKESEATGFSQADTVLAFDSNDFYLTSGGDTNPLVSLKKIDHGALSGLTDDDHTQYILRDGTRSFTGVLTGNLHVDQVVVAEAFYLQPGSGGEISKSGENILIRPVVGGKVDIRGHASVGDTLNVANAVTAEAFYLTTGGELTVGGEANTASNLGAGSGVFAQKSGVDLQFKSLVAGSNITLTPAADSITIASTSSGGGGGFYGVIFRDGIHTHRDDTLRFNSNEFYLSDENGKPQLNLIGGLVGEANTASNLGAGEGIFSQKVGVDLQLKSLVAGSGVTLTSDVNTITVASPTGAAGVFYGVIFDDGSTVYRDDELQFNPSDFYLSQDADGKPKLNLVNGPTTASNLGAGSGVFAQKVGDDLQFKSLVAGTNITLTPSATGITIDAAAGGGGGGGFYGVIFKESQTNGYRERDDELVFDSNFFYLTSNNKGKPIVSLASVNGFDGIPLKAVAFVTDVLEYNLDHSFNTDDVVWSVYDRTGRALIPMDVYMHDNIADFYFAQTFTGRIVLYAMTPDYPGAF